MPENTQGRWDDEVKDMIGLRLSSASGKVSYNYDEQAVTFSPGGVMGTLADMVGANFEIKHGEYRGFGAYTNIHLHWGQPDVQNYEISYRYRIHRNGQERPTAWITGTATIGNNGANDAFTHPDDGNIMDQVSSILKLDISALSLSDTIKFQMTRSDAVVGDWDADVLDRHVKSNDNGSINEFSNDQV